MPHEKLENLVDKIKQEETKTIKTIRFMIDNNILHYDKNMKLTITK